MMLLRARLGVVVVEAMTTFVSGSVLCVRNHLTDKQTDKPGVSKSEPAPSLSLLVPVPLHAAAGAACVRGWMGGWV